MTEYQNHHPYTLLDSILHRALLQAAEGKGAERHANGKPFEKQPIMEIGRMVGPGFAAGQAMKKLQEAMGMVARGSSVSAVQELLGTIVYAAATIALIEEYSHGDC